MIKQTLLIIIILTITGCMDRKKSLLKKNDNEKIIEVSQLTEELKYITAKSGLIYRDKPKGKRLGKFEFNQPIVITKHTENFQEIKKGNETIKGEWLGTKIDNKEVYVFSGYLSNNKSKITIDDVKNFMGDYIWVSEDFKNILRETKSFKKSFFYGFSLDLKYKKTENYDILEGYFHKAQDDIIYNLESLLNEDDTKIIDINNKTLTIKNKNKKYLFFNNNYKSAIDLFEDWFKGDYILKSKNSQKKYTSKEITYTSELGIDIMYIDSSIYKIDEVKENLYYLSEIKFTESEKEDEKWEMGGDFEYDIVNITPTGKKGILTKTK